MAARRHLLRRFLTLGCGALACLLGGCSEDREPVIGKHEVFGGMLNRFPDFQTLLTVEQLDTFVDTIKKKHPEVTTLTQRAVTEGGRPFYELTIGSGSHHALVYALAEPDDAVGSMMMMFLANEIGENGLLTHFVDFTWHFVFCADPDQAILADPWLDGPWTLDTYAEGTYIPPHNRRIEWMTSEDAPSQAQQAMKSVIADTPIEIMIGLRSTAFGGVSCVVADDDPELYALLNRTLGVESFPRRGQGDHVPDGAHFVAPGFYKLDTTPGVTGAHQMMRFAKERHPDLVSVALEIPYFLDPRIVDRNLSEQWYVDAMTQAQERYDATMEFIAQQYAAVRDNLSTETRPWADAVADILKNRMVHVPVEETQRLATVAESVDAILDYDVVALSNLGQLLRLLKAEKILGKGIVSKTIDDAFGDVSSRFDTLATETEKALDYTVISIKRAASLQMLIALYLADFVQDRAQQ